MATISKDRASAGSGAAAFFGAAAVGVVAGLTANIARKAAVQGVTAVSGDWLEGLKAEHAMTLKIFDGIEATKDDQTGKRSFLLMQLKHALGKHAFQEENVVYASLRKFGLAEEADKFSHEHAYVKQHLFNLTELPKDDPAWIEEVRAFRREIEQHIRTEEDTVFPRLHEKLGDEGNKHITWSMNKEGFKLA